VGGGEVGEELELGAAKRRTVKGGRPTFVLNEIGSVARAERKKKGGRRGAHPRGGERRRREGALRSGRQRGPADSGAVLRTGEGGGARPTRCRSG
jgi:hypothetical protein